MYAHNVQTVTEYFCALEQSNHLLLVARSFSLLANLSFVFVCSGTGHLLWLPEFQWTIGES